MPLVFFECNFINKIVNNIIEKSIEYVSSPYKYCDYWRYLVK